MDEVWFYYILPILAAALVAFVEWRHRADATELVGRVAALENAHNNLVSVISDMDAPDLSSIDKRLYEAEKAIAILSMQMKGLSEE